MDELDNILSQLDEPVNTTINQSIIIQEQVPTEQGIVPPAEIVDDNPVKVKEFIDRYETGFTEILSSVRSDRTEAQKAIDFCSVELNKMVTAGSRVNASLVESLVQAIKVKADINTNYIKCLDAGAKLLSATKSAVSITNTNVNSNDVNELTTLLQQPMIEDDI